MRLADIDLTDLALFEQGTPHDVFGLLRREAPVWFQEPTAHTPDGIGFWNLTRHVDVHAAAVDSETFSSERGPGQDGGGTLIQDLPWGWASGVLFNMMDDPRHHHIRRLLTPVFAPKSLAAMEPELRDRNAAILDAVAEKGACDFLVDVAAELPLQAVARLLGMPQEDRHQLFEWANIMLDHEDRELGADTPEFRRAIGEMAAYGAALLASKRGCPAHGDILGVVANSEVSGANGGMEPITEAEQGMFFNLVLAAGSETTRNAIAGGLAALIENPDELARLRAHPDLLPSAVEEMLRYTNATTYNRRTATRDIEIGGHEIRSGDKIVLWWASANRDEAVFAEPHRFDITRDPNPHLTFGVGTHYCLGAKLARLEMRIVFEQLLERFDEFALAGPIEWVRSNKHTGIRHMPITFSGRSESVIRGARV